MQEIRRYFLARVSRTYDKHLISSDQESKVYNKNYSIGRFVVYTKPATPYVYNTSPICEKHRNFRVKYLI